MTNQYLSVKSVASRYDVTPNTVWRWSRCTPDFPAPVKLSNGSSRWMLQELCDWEDCNERY
ncbi:MAG: AlpA family transcriptional regulator [Hellea sp.]